jgi:hypothetical protein
LASAGLVLSFLVTQCPFDCVLPGLFVDVRQSRGVPPPWSCSTWAFLVKKRRGGYSELIPLGEDSPPQVRGPDPNLVKRPLESLQDPTAERESQRRVGQLVDRPLQVGQVRGEAVPLSCDRVPLLK